MWLMVILCMVPGFLLCCTWVLLCKDTRERGGASFFVAVDVFIPFFFRLAEEEEEEDAAESLIAGR